jgi:hypothetical protein
MSIDAYDKEKLKSIGNNFLQYTRVKSIDLSGLTNLKKIGENFMENCIDLEIINLKQPILKIKLITKY